MQYVHIVMMILAIWRLMEEYFRVGSILEPIRVFGEKSRIGLLKKFLGCQFCLSFWVSALCVAFFVPSIEPINRFHPVLFTILPFFNWFLAGSFLYLIRDRIMGLLPQRRRGVFLQFGPNGVRPDFQDEPPREAIERIRDYLKYIDDHDRKNAEQIAQVRASRKPKD